MATRPTSSPYVVALALLPKSSTSRSWCPQIWRATATRTVVSASANSTNNGNNANQSESIASNSSIAAASAVHPPTTTSTTAASSSNGRGYTVAVGKGVRHQLNGYLRTNAPAPAAPPAAAAAHVANDTNNTSSTMSITSTTSTSSYSSYLSHPSAKLASSAPAPLQFLDPSELGMSIENSLSQLKNNFAAATSNGVKSSGASHVAGGPITTALSSTATSSSAAATDPATSSSMANASSSTLSTFAIGNATSSEHSSSSGNAQSSNVKYAPSSLTRRVSSMAFLGGMLSRDDSLINLAMLPTLDNDNTNGTNNNGTMDVGTGGTNSNSISSSQDYMTAIFSRDDSLMNLAKIVDAVTGTDSAPSSTTAAASASGTECTAKSRPDDRNEGLGGGENGSSDTFGFIDFPS
mmetsp:Transcript_12762/g.27722  ORF Transcript_12762/g.27722 Transcript_12762/m.27722 type:complete len:408 (+) Transcript_12762:265-1488(+)